ncbi:hypothetical protein GGR74_002083 [Xanthomonas arboricola]
MFALHFPGTTKRHRLEENLGGAALTLSGEDLARIQQALDAVAIVGERYRPERQKQITPAINSPNRRCCRSVPARDGALPIRPRRAQARSYTSIPTHQSVPQYVGHQPQTCRQPTLL